MAKTNNCQVMMVGTDLNTKGGISSVVQGYFDAGIMGRLGIHYYPTHRDGSRSDKVFFYMRGLLKIIINMPKYDIVHVHTASWWSYRRLFFVILLAKILHKKIVIHLHGGKFDIYYGQAFFIEKVIIRYGFSLADRVVVLSSEWLKKIAAVCDLRKVLVIPNSVQIPFQKGNPISKKTNNILFMGDLIPRKGVYDLLEAIKLLDLERNRVIVRLCGNGEIEKVKKRAADLGLEEIVNVPGWVTGQEKKKLLDEAYLYVLPSYHEGLPMSILEAMATGTPVISTPVGGIAEVVEDGVEGFLVEPGDVKALASAIRTLLDDTVVWKKMSVAVMEKVQSQFSSKQTLAQLKRLYNDLGVA